MSPNEHLRCKRCRKIPRGKMALAQREKYQPYCSFHCQEWGKLDDARRHLATLETRK